MTTMTCERPQVHDELKFITLPNGALILMSERTGPSEWVVLALWEKGKCHEFITWVVDEDGNAYWGNYSRSLPMALQSFAERISKH